MNTVSKVAAICAATCMASIAPLTPATAVDLVGHIDAYADDGYKGTHSGGYTMAGTYVLHFPARSFKYSTPYGSAPVTLCNFDKQVGFYTSFVQKPELPDSLHFNKIILGPRGGAGPATC